MAGARRPAQVEFPFPCCYCGRDGVRFFHPWDYHGPLAEACSVGPHSCQARVGAGLAASPPDLLAPALGAVLRPMTRGMVGLPQDFELRLAQFLEVLA